MCWCTYVCLSKWSLNNTCTFRSYIYKACNYIEWHIIVSHVHLYIFILWLHISVYIFDVYISMIYDAYIFVSCMWSLWCVYMCTICLPVTCISFYQDMLVNVINVSIQRNLCTRNKRKNKKDGNWDEHIRLRIFGVRALSSVTIRKILQYFTLFVFYEILFDIYTVAFLFHFNFAFSFYLVSFYYFLFSLWTDFS